MSNSRDLRFLSVPPNRSIESSEAPPPGQGHAHNFLFHGTRVATLYQGRRNRHSESQRGHDDGRHRQWQVYVVRAGRVDSHLSGSLP